MKESNNIEEISIKIQTLDNTYSFKINPSYTILQLKEEISKKYNIPKERQRLIFQGKFLKENEKLSFYKITDGCVIQLIAKSLEENNGQNSSQQNRNQNSSEPNNNRLNEVYPIIQIPFRTNRRRRRVVMPHFDISEYIEGFYQNIISLDNFNNCKKSFNYNNNSSNNNLIEAFDFSKSAYEVGEWVDVKDTINQWLEAQVMKVQNNKAYVHYNGWGTRWDEWIEFDSPRMRNFKTYTLQSPLTFCTSPYPAIPCDSNIEPQERPIDIFFYLEKTKNYLMNLLDDMNRLLFLRKKNVSIFKDNKLNIDNYEILFKATQMIPFLDRVGRMLSDISLIFSHFIVNPNYYSSFLFGYKRQDLFNEIEKMKSHRSNDIFDEKNNKNEIIVSQNEDKDTQTPPIENSYLKKIQQQSQSQKTQLNSNLPNSSKKPPEKKNIQVNSKNQKEELNKPNDKKEKNESSNNNKQKSPKNKKEITNNENKIEDKKEKNLNKKEDNTLKEKENNEKDKDKIEDKKDTKNINQKIKENFNNNKDENQNLHHRHNSYSAPSITEEDENMNSANFQRQRQRIAQEEIQPNQIATNLGYDLSFSSVELPFIQRIIYSYTLSDRIISPLSPFYQIFSNKKLFPRVNLQIPTMLPPGEVMMMTGYSPFSEPNFDIYIHTISVNPNNRNENEGNNNSNKNNTNNNVNNNNINTNATNTNNSEGNTINNSNNSQNNNNTQKENK